MANYYPWNTQTFIAWVKAELSKGEDPQDLAKNLRIPVPVFSEWLLQSSPSAVSPITLEQIHAVARLRGWKLDKTLEWLGIGSAHLAELKAEARAASRTKG